MLFRLYRSGRLLKKNSKLDRFLSIRINLSGVLLAVLPLFVRLHKQVVYQGTRKNTDKNWMETAGR